MRATTSSLVSKAIQRSFGTSQKAAPAFNVTGLKRFYKHVDVIEHPESEIIDKLNASEAISHHNLSKTSDKYWAVCLDGRVMKTLYKD
jgi:ATP synthase mitochondrial F1 complex assembly factor 2